MARTTSGGSWREPLGRVARRTIWPAALAFGIVTVVLGQPDLVVLDALAGFALLGFGLTAWSSRPRPRRAR